MRTGTTENSTDCHKPYIRIVRNGWHQKWCYTIVHLTSQVVPRCK